MRFLRLEMELTQRDLAAALGTTEQTLRLWEKHRDKAIHGSADRLLRIFYSEPIGGDPSMRRLIERMAAVDPCAERQARLRETDQGWKLDRAEAA